MNDNTADAAEKWLQQKTTEVRKRIDAMRASDALAGDNQAQSLTKHQSRDSRALQKATGPLQAEDAATLAAIQRINRKERAQKEGQ